MRVMKSLREFRLVNLSGHCIQVEANVPVVVPPALHEDALAAGMVETDEPVPGGRRH